MVAHDSATAIAALRRAIPYLRLYQGRVFVIKAGGEVFAEASSRRAVLEQVGALHQLGIRCVLVHGGGPQATDLAQRLGIETRMVDGRRVTGVESLEVATMVLNGTMNTQLVAECAEVGIRAVGLSGVDAGLLRARRRPPQTRPDGEVVDYGYVGDLVACDTSVLEHLLNQGYLPVVSPLSADGEGTILNVNADTAAARLARELRASKLLLVVGVPGVLRDPEDPTSLVSYTDLAGLTAMERSGSLRGGMLPKAASIREALEGGVERVHVISSKVPDSILREVFTNEGSGTLVVRSTQELRPEEVGTESAAAGGVRR